MIGNDRELSPGAYPPKLIRRTPRNNAGHGREEGPGRSFRGFSSFFSLRKRLFVRDERRRTYFLAGFPGVEVVFRIALFFCLQEKEAVGGAARVSLRFHRKREFGELQ